MILGISNEYLVKNLKQYVYDWFYNDSIVIKFSAERVKSYHKNISLLMILIIFKLYSAILNSSISPAVSSSDFG